LSHHRFSELTRFLHAGDVLVLNTSKVLPARLYGRKAETGGAVECLLVRRTATDTWEVMLGGSNMRTGLVIDFSVGSVALRGTIGERISPETWSVQFSLSGVEFDTALAEIGNTPIPPYIKDHGMDESALRERYQTVYAKEEGSVAAPTAGLHFTPEMLDALRAIGVEIAHVVLHVGIGTFAPVKVDDVSQHKMHAEFAQVSAETATQINRAKKEGRRIIAVGTTTTRTLESFMQEGVLQSGERWTDIFITPGYTFQCVDGLITNFHLPKSTLLMLVSALAGREFVMRAYEEAVREKYRFYSFGDAMLII
jgi:S-adenosylmethionine:tRNA ribosyltransferase-isomerase